MCSVDLVFSLRTYHPDTFSSLLDQDIHLLPETLGAQEQRPWCAAGARVVRGQTRLMKAYRTVAFRGRRRGGRGSEVKFSDRALPGILDFS
ncbi:hypothetical protein DPEC_G00215030 [Dallia pectoralis]|uniref:Uncharacterized protein n=1 Tax=Dallia pectoralis TaxID=75939 RepID=A0ACC2G1V0_DALPE|nr:hypothetical protein DPEC_G00215030 [Dallia pectoralis]